MKSEDVALEQARGAFLTNLHWLVNHSTLERKPDALRDLVARATERLGAAEVNALITSLPETLRTEVLSARGNAT